MSKIGLIENTATTEEVTAPVDGAVSDTQDVSQDINLNGENVEADNTEDTADLAGGENTGEVTSEVSADGELTADPALNEGDSSEPVMDEGYIDPGFYEGEITDPGMMETASAEVKDPLLSSWPFVIGISAAVLVVSIAIGAFLAKLKIKKGIDLYED